MKVSRPVNLDTIAKLNSRLSLVDVCVTGYWFCRGCQRITELEDGNNGSMVCGICGSFNVKHHLPIFTHEESEMYRARRAAVVNSLPVCKATVER